MHLIRIVFFIFLISILAACAGRQFVRPSGELIQLGKTTEKQIIATMGKPEPDFTTWTERLNKKVKQICYAYMVGYAGKPNSRTACFFFFEGVLIGHYFTSNFSGESTYFDLTKVRNIAENKSTSREVIEALGKPAGEAIYPFLTYPEGRVLWYRFHDPSGFITADFEIDKDDIVRHIWVRVF